MASTTSSLAAPQKKKKNRMTKKNRNWALYPAARVTVALFPVFFRFLPDFLKNARFFL
jgi:hypothetical protein